MEGYSVVKFKALVISAPSLLSPCRYLMFYYPVISALVGTSLNMLFLCTVILLSWLRFFSGPEEYDDEDELEVESDKDAIKKEEDERRVEAAEEKLLKAVDSSRRSSSHGSGVFELSPDTVEVLEDPAKDDDADGGMECVKRRGRPMEE